MTAPTTAIPIILRQRMPPPPSNHEVVQLAVESARRILLIGEIVQHRGHPPGKRTEGKKREQKEPSEKCSLFPLILSNPPQTPVSYPETPNLSTLSPPTLPSPNLYLTIYTFINLLFLSLTAPYPPPTLHLPSTTLLSIHAPASSLTPDPRSTLSPPFKSFPPPPSTFPHLDNHVTSCPPLFTNAVLKLFPLNVLLIINFLPLVHHHLPLSSPPPFFPSLIPRTLQTLAPPPPPLPPPNTPPTLPPPPLPTSHTIPFRLPPPPNQSPPPITPIPPISQLPLLIYLPIPPPHLPFLPLT